MCFDTSIFFKDKQNHIFNVLGKRTAVLLRILIQTAVFNLPRLEMTLLY